MRSNTILVLADLHFGDTNIHFMLCVAEDVISHFGRSPYTYLHQWSELSQEYKNDMELRFAARQKGRRERIKEQKMGENSSRVWHSADASQIEDLLIICQTRGEGKPHK